nr:4Fe-4S dicluster domain-containing protein [Arenimonas daejeonensis]
MSTVREPLFDHPRRPLAQRLGAILWPSFFAAGVATMVFFAFVDPLALAEMTFPGLEISRGLGYTPGFFMFWACTASASLFHLDPAAAREPLQPAAGQGLTVVAGNIPLNVVEESGPYVSEKKIYPREQDGRFQRLRKAAVVWLLGMYYAFAWLQWDDRQAVLWDLPARKFYVFGLVFWPQDFFYLALLLIMAGLTLFFFTALAGRIWCGYACPQTVWTEVFIWMERWAEGDRGRQMKLDAAPWSRDKVLRKTAKHTMWLVFALWTGFTFVGYFTPIRDLADRISPFAWGGWETFWVLFYALATWGNAGFLREQVCKYMCPYARFQSAMFDRNTLIVAYDPRRGESRGARRKGSLASVLERARGLLPMDVANSAVVAAAQHRSAADLRIGARATTGLVVDAQSDLPPAPEVNSPRTSATASTARSACRSARPASTSATACSTSASPVAPAWMPATR